MTVLNFWSEQHRDTPVDLFVTEPFDFEAEWSRALVKSLGPIAVRFVSIPSLIRMKRSQAGRRIKSTSNSYESWQMARIEDKAIDWSLTTWGGAEREQLRRWSQLSLEDIVRAQEEMQDLADRLGRTDKETKPK